MFHFVTDDPRGRQCKDNESHKFDRRLFDFSVVFFAGTISIVILRIVLKLEQAVPQQ